MNRDFDLGIARAGTKDGVPAAPLSVSGRHRLVRRVLCAAALAALAGCAPGWLAPLETDHPLVGRIWDTRAAGFIAREVLIERATAAHSVILGEAHDNPDHHRLQAEVLGAMLAAGRRPVLAMEQFDSEVQDRLDAALARGERDPERIADAGRFDRKGWDWPAYRPLVELAAANGLRLAAANLSRERARALMRSGRTAPGLAPAAPPQQAALEGDIIEGHCGMRPSAAVLLGMVEAQRARDAQIAASLVGTAAAGAVLITGAGHARRDRGAPSHLPPATSDRLLVIAFVEVDVARRHAPDYLRTVSGTTFDLLWFTPRAARADPCKNLRMP